MKDLLLDDDGDIAIRNFDLAFTETDEQYVSQKLGFKLTLVQGEWFLDRSKGIAYFKDVYRKNPDLKIIGDLFKREILSVPLIRKISRFDLGVSVKRELLIDFEVLLETGESVSYKETL